MHERMLAIRIDFNFSIDTVCLKAFKLLKESASALLRRSSLLFQEYTASEE